MFQTDEFFLPAATKPEREAPVLFWAHVGVGVRRDEISAEVAPHFIEHPHREAEACCNLVLELHLHDFSNIQSGVGLKADACLADVGTEPVARNLIQ